MQKKETAKQAYKDRKKAIEKLIASIEAKLERHTKGQTIHWAHVGDLGHIRELLENIDQFFG